jgi:hypothetical protein
MQRPKLPTVYCHVADLVLNQTNQTTSTGKMQARIKYKKLPGSQAGPFCSTSYEEARGSVIGKVQHDVHTSQPSKRVQHNAPLQSVCLGEAADRLNTFAICALWLWDKI